MPVYRRTPTFERASRPTHSKREPPRSGSLFRAASKRRLISVRGNQMPEPCCYRGHDLTADRARLPNGKCRLCDKINQKNYQRRVKIGTALLHAVEDRGLSVGEALALV